MLDKTIAYTREQQHLVQTYVEVVEGTPVYEADDFSQLTAISPEPVHCTKRGRLSREQDGYVCITIPGGEVLFVEKKYLIYPEALD